LPTMVPSTFLLMAISVLVNIITSLAWEKLASRTSEERRQFLTQLLSANSVLASAQGLVALVVETSLSTWLTVALERRRLDATDGTGRLSANNRRSSTTTIAGLMVVHRASNSAAAKFAIVAATSLYVALSFKFGATSSPWVLGSLALLFMALSVQDWLLSYRIRKGLYGSSEHEAREMLEFIVAHSDKFDFTDGDRLRKLLPDTEASTSDETPGQLHPELV